MSTTPSNITISNYLTRVVVRQRNSITLIQWAASMAVEAIPSPVTTAWVQQRVVAESIPQTLDTYVTQTLSYFLQDPGTISSILLFISTDNDTATEATLSAENAAIASAFMPRFAAATVTDAQVVAWCTQNNVPVPTP